MIPKLDFDILDTYDLRVMRVVDNSSWEHLYKETTYIDVITPAKTKPVTNYFYKDKINTLNSNNLELTMTHQKGELQPLPDGVYKIKIYVCEGDKFSYETCYLRTIKTMIELDKVLIDMNVKGCETDAKTLERYLKIELLLKSAHANVRQGNVEQGMCEFDKAKDMIAKFKTC